MSEYSELNEDRRMEVIDLIIDLYGSGFMPPDDLIPFLDRIVACLNFCEGIPTEFLNALADHPNARADILERVESWIEFNPHLFTKLPLTPPAADA